MMIRERAVVRVRQATDEDTGALLLLRRQAILALRSAHYSPDQIAVWADAPAGELGGAVDDPEWSVLVAERDTALVGFGAIRYQDRPHLWALYVSPQWARRGTGTALLAALERDARRHGCSALWVAASLNAARFYERRGYGRGVPFTFDMESISGEATLVAVKMIKRLDTVAARPQEARP